MPSTKKFSRRYPWDKWFKKNRFKLKIGDDFNGRCDTFAQHIRNMAKERGLVVHISIASDAQSIVVTVTSRG